MPTICSVAAAGAALIMRTRDHCPAHVHAINSGSRWEFKIFFAYADNDPKHLTIEIVIGKPSIGQINDVIDAVNARLDLCRKQWWEIMADTCLVNQVVTITSAGVLKKVAPHAGVKVKDAEYEPSRREVTFRGHTSSVSVSGRCP